MTALRKGEFYQNSLTQSDETRFMIDSMTTMDLSFDYRFDLDMSGITARVRFAIKNIATNVPLADRYSVILLMHTRLWSKLLLRSEC